MRSEPSQGISVSPVSRGTLPPCKQALILIGYARKISGKIDVTNHKAVDQALMN